MKKLLITLVKLSLCFAPGLWLASRFDVLLPLDTVGEEGLDLLTAFKGRYYLAPTIASDPDSS